MADGQTNSELDNERNIRDLKKKQEKQTAERMRQLRSEYDTDMDREKKEIKAKL